MDRAEFWNRVRPLGNLRCRILQCLGTDNPRLPAYFEPPADRPIGESIRDHLVELHRRFAEDTESQRIVAAGLLSFGDLGSAKEILSRFPSHAIVLDQGTGWCSLIAYQTVAALLPVPDAIGNVARWVEDSDTAKAVREWFHANRERLSWDERVERFVAKPCTD